MGTMAASMAPSRSALRAASTDPYAVRAPTLPGAHASSAIEVKVPSGPRKP